MVDKSGCFIVLIERHQCHRAVRCSRRRTHISWTEEQFHVCHVMRRNSVSTHHVEAMKLSKLANASNANARSAKLFVHTMEELINYTGVFELEYSVQFLVARTKDIVDSTQSSDYLPNRGRGTYSRYIRFSKLAVRNKESLDLLGALSSVHTSGNALSLSHLDSPVLYVLEPNNALLFEAANIYVTNQTKTPIFHCSSI